MLRKYAGSIAILVIASILTALAFIWKGYAFSNLSTVLIGDQLDTLSNAANLYQAFDNLWHRPGNLTYGLFSTTIQCRWSTPSRHIALQ
jgi:hypothetical protein